MALNRWATAIFCAGLIFGIMATVAVALRIWSRRLQKMRLTFNDYAIIMALVWTYGVFSASLIFIFRSDLGDNEREVPMKNLITLFKTFIPAVILWALANTFVRASILHLYICLFPHPRFLLAAYITMTMTIVYIIFVTIGYFTICRPFSYLWDKSQHGQCGNQVALYLASGIFNLILDVTVLVLPMPMLWGLQMATRKKISLTGVFGLGAGICVITILRIKYLSSVDLQNITYSVAPAWLFTLLEPMLGILNACLPVIRPAITKLSRNTKMPSSKHSRSKASTSAKNSSHGQSSGFTPKRFQRLDEHAYPLTETSGNFNLNDIGGLENDASSGDQDVEQQTYASNPRDQKDAIVIKSG